MKGGSFGSHGNTVIPEQAYFASSETNSAAILHI